MGTAMLSSNFYVTMKDSTPAEQRRGGNLTDIEHVVEKHAIKL